MRQKAGFTGFFFDIFKSVKNKKDLNILYVEDSETNQLVMSAMMERLGVSLALASSAKEGFDAL